MPESERVSLRLVDRIHNTKDSEIGLFIRDMTTQQLRHCSALCRKYTAIEMGKNHPNLDFINKWRKAQIDYAKQLALREPLEAQARVS